MDNFKDKRNTYRVKVDELKEKIRVLYKVETTYQKKPKRVKKILKTLDFNCILRLLFDISVLKLSIRTFSLINIF